MASADRNGSCKLNGNTSLSEAEIDYILDNNITEKFGLLRGVQGYCLDTMSYDRARQLITEASQETLGTMGRDAASTVVYRQFRTKVHFCVTVSSFPQSNVNVTGQSLLYKRVVQYRSGCVVLRDQSSLYAPFPILIPVLKLRDNRPQDA